MIFKISVSIILAVILIYMIISLLRGTKTDRSSNLPDSEKPYRNCPLCGSPLRKGETVHSHLYPGKPDGMMHIYGCPFCYKDHPRVKELKDVKRICPYCKKEVSKDGWVIARVFEKPKKTHIHVLGCTECRKVR